MYKRQGVRYDLSNALHTDMFTAVDSEIQADGLPYDILYSTIAADAKSQPEHQLKMCIRDSGIDAPINPRQLQIKHLRACN